MPAPSRDPLSLFARDILAGFGLLTRVPVPFTPPRPQGAWAWPLVGLGVAGLDGAGGLLLMVASRCLRS